MKNPKNNFGFGAIGVVIVLLVLAVVGLAGYIVWDGAGADDGLSTTSQQTSSVQTSTTPTDSLPTKDPNEGYFVVKEWGLRFKVPPSIFDVRYKIKGDTFNGDTLAFYAKPTGLKYDYVKDYDQVSDSGFFSLANGVIYRSKESTKDKIGIVVEGKKIGDYYYYTAWSFSGLATGAACLPLYEISDQELCEEVHKAFRIVNDDFIKSIELAK